MDASGEPPAKRPRSDSAPPSVAHEREVLGRSITDALLQASSHVLKEYMPDVTTERQARARRPRTPARRQAALRCQAGARGSAWGPAGAVPGCPVSDGLSAQVVLLAVANMASTVVELIMPTIQARSRACRGGAGGDAPAATRHFPRFRPDIPGGGPAQSVIRDRLARATPVAPPPPAPLPPPAPPPQQLYNPALPASATLFALQQILAPQGQAPPAAMRQPAPRMDPPVAPLAPPRLVLTLPPPQPRSTPARPPPLQPPAVPLAAGQLRLVIVNECPEGFGSWRPVECVGSRAGPPGQALTRLLASQVAQQRPHPLPGAV